MIDIVVATHGPLSKAFEETVTLIVGETTPITYVGFFHGDDVEHLEQEIQSKIFTSLEQKRQVLVFIDLLGGSPSNRSALILNKLNENMPNVEFVAGVNLPMLIEAVVNSQTVGNVQELKEKAITAGSEGIADLKQLFNVNGGDPS
ncbi:PTS sugar transporter subunit IIA [Candidatus Enterococcus ferrettii]|uniref:PTS system, mannose-specific IIA component n=1 Tax=Candidatus Enterococcus ferrettii TaxID=2815324 RepID=A0ABV0ERT9_9ENTE|nr:PTS N-acetylglucosamine transporter subunit IIC [Enterococcus sp. 665A]MBO1341221.1 PTS N-acetylglucosamine transporter subunit IIC [Enterococcus sp. 665A]